MIVLGPNTIANGTDPETVLMVSGDTCILGPSEGPTKEVDPLSHIFLLLGKIISARRVCTQDRVMNLRPPAAIETLGGLQAVITEYSKEDDTGDEWELVWQPLAENIEQSGVDPLARHVADIDRRLTRLFVSETQAILALDPNLTLEQRVEAVDLYLRMKGFTVEASSGGFRDFIATAFQDTCGRRINLPTSTNPSFPDSWITPEVVDAAAHGGSRREWSLIW